MRSIATLARAAIVSGVCCTLAGQLKAQVIFTFAPPVVGQGLEGPVIMDASGALYGTTVGGGPANAGTIFKLTPPAAGQADWTETTLYVFQGGADGGFPDSALTLDSSGALYGVTANPGTAFKLTPPVQGQSAWTKSTLYEFSNSNYPTSSLLPGPHGSFYGATEQPGSGGIVYQLVPPISGGTNWTLTTLHQFTGDADGGYLNGSLLMDRTGNLYGTAGFGGIVNEFCSSGCGVVYRLSPPPSGTGNWTLNVLYSFEGGTDGEYSVTGVIAGPEGTLVGDTIHGGDAVTNYGGDGTVFQLTPPKSGIGGWTETVIQRFSGGLGGTNPSTLALRPDGDLVGTTSGGGAGKGVCVQFAGCGTVFELSPPPPGVVEWTLARSGNFQPGTGASPSGLTLENDKVLYITTSSLGPLPKAAGTVVQINLGKN